MGLLARIRDLLPPSLRKGKVDHPISKDPVEEAIRSGMPGLKIPWFLPFVDDPTGETLTMRNTYRRMMSDPIVKSAVMGKILGVAGLDLKVNPSNKRDPGAKQLAEFCQWVLTQRLNGQAPGLLWNILIGACIDGYSVLEKIWGVQERGQWRGKLILRFAKPKDVGRELILLTDEFKNVTGVQGQFHNSGEYWHPDDFIIFRHLPLYGSPVGMSDFRAVYSRYWVLDTAWKLRAMAMEKRAIPLLFGEYIATTQQAGMEESLEQAKYTNWISAPVGCRVQAIEIAGTADSIFQQTIHDLREDIVFGIQGALLQALTGGQGEQRGNSVVHKDTADLLKWFLSAMVQATLNDEETGLIPDICDKNFSGVSEYPRAVLEGVDEAELGESLRVDQGLATLVPLSKEDLYERYGRATPRGPTDATTVVSASPFGDPLGLPGLDAGQAQQGGLADEVAAQGGNAASGLRATVGGSTAVAALQRSYYSGEIPRNAAIANATVVFGFTVEEAERLFPEEAPQKLTPVEGEISVAPPAPGASFAAPGGRGALPFGRRINGRLTKK